MTTFRVASGSGISILRAGSRWGLCAAREARRAKKAEHGVLAVSNVLAAEQIELRGPVSDAKAVVALRDEPPKRLSEGERVLNRSRFSILKAGQ